MVRSAHLLRGFLFYADGLDHAISNSEPKSALETGLNVTPLPLTKLTQTNTMKPREEKINEHRRTRRVP